ncbi:MAG: hypothetical protein Q4F95_08150 [Oscillospiraceae bacterium]|nr:hypothetical protein [Oscillospiraceae bacterium]
MIQDTYISLTQNQLSLIEKGDLNICPDGLFTADNKQLAYLCALKSRSGDTPDSISFCPVPLLADTEASDILQKLWLISPLMTVKNQSVLSMQDNPLINTVSSLINNSLMNPDEKSLCEILRLAGESIKNCAHRPVPENVTVFCELLQNLIGVCTGLFARTADTKDSSLFLILNNAAGSLDKLIEKTYSNKKSLTPGIAEYELLMLFTMSLSLPVIISEYCTQFYKQSHRMPASADSWLWTFGKLDSDLFRSGVLNCVSFRYPALSCIKLMNAHSFPVNAACHMASLFRDMMYFIENGEDRQSLREKAMLSINNKCFSLSEKLYCDPLIFSKL